MAEETHPYKESDWTRHPAYIAYRGDTTLKCSMVADWLMKYYYALTNATEHAFVETVPEYRRPDEEPFNAAQFTKHLNYVLEATAEETVDTRPYMNATQREVDKLIQMAKEKASPEEIHKQVSKLRDTYLDNATHLICACERGELPVSDEDQIKKHEGIIESWEPTTKKMLEEGFGFDIRPLLP